jgi:tellurite resistance protein TerC
VGRLFLLAGVVDTFHYLKQGLSLVLGFVGVKMVVETISDYTMAHPLHVPIQWSLLVIAVVLGASVGASLLFPRRELALAEATEPTAEELPRSVTELPG